MMQAPWTDVGRIQQDVSQLQSQIYGKVDKYEISSLNSKVDGLESEVRSLSATCDGLRFELSQLQENFRQALEILGQITTVL